MLPSLGIFLLVAFGAFVAFLIGVAFTKLFGLLD
jgi:hypothetical protein